MTDAELIARVVVDDDRRAFATLLDRHQAPVRSLLRRLTGGRQALADDLAQETFLRAYRHLSACTIALRPWLLRIAYRVFIDETRKRSELLGVEHEAALLPELSARHDAQTMLMFLPPAERAVFVLAFGFECSHSEIAEMLDLPLGTVKTHIATARSRFEKERAHG